MGCKMQLDFGDLLTLTEKESRIACCCSSRQQRTTRMLPQVLDHWTRFNTNTWGSLTFGREDGLQLRGEAPPAWGARGLQWV